RDQSGSYEVLEVGDRGDFGIWRREQDHWVELVPWTPSEAVRRGDLPNELEVRAIGQRVDLLVNGVLLASREGTPPAGGVGVFVGGDFNEVLLERFLVRTAGGAETMATELAANPPAPPPSPEPARFLPITRIAIPDIALDAEAVPAQLIENHGGVTWQVPPFKVGHAEASAGAGSPGNAVLLGHVRSRAEGNVFANLHSVRPGEVVQVFSGPLSFNYRVVDVRTVSRTDLSVVRPTSSPSVTLITCTGVWLPLLSDYTERVVVRAERTSAEP
ncbi:MAG: class F sortase, partial [Chloroflexota bacterium]|nr:class F sortase [Chloroflexota bacterium]